MCVQGENQPLIVNVPTSENITAQIIPGKRYKIQTTLSPGLYPLCLSLQFYFQHSKYFSLWLLPTIPSLLYLSNHFSDRRKETITQQERICFANRNGPVVLFRNEGAGAACPLGRCPSNSLPAATLLALTRTETGEVAARLDLLIRSLAIKIFVYSGTSG